ncbi:MAG: hypothetical protein MUF51_06710 [Vicinamibacteria bacterium]|jgi:hypothetical protein|nr:hypothetical protein [Vicinamibacteria bacterium]
MRKMTVWAGLVLLAGVGIACSKEEPKKREKNLGDLAAATAVDTEILRGANDAANAVVRVTGDCDAVKAALPEAEHKFNDIEPKLKTQTGRDTLNMLRKQVRNIADTCP